MVIEKCSAYSASEVKKIINKMWPSKTAEEILQSLKSDKEVIFIAKNGGAITGFVHGIIRSDFMEGITEYPALYIEGIFVEDEYRNKRIASLLVEKLIEYGKEKNIKQIASDCREDNAQSYNFHLKNNFDVYGKTVHFIKEIKP